MSTIDIAGQRLFHQQLLQTSFKQPHEVVSWFGAMQSQEYANSKWGIGVRLPGSTDADIEKAISNKSIVRTSALRGTLHLMAAEDIRWILTLIQPNVMTRMRSIERKLGMDDHLFDKTNQLIKKALEGGQQLIRKELIALMQEKGINTEENRMNHILYRASLTGIICNGPLRGKQHTHTLLDEWLPVSKQLSREQSLSTLAQRYFTSHGPATVADFALWSGLSVTDARAGLEMVKKSLVSHRINEAEYWTAPGKVNVPDDTAFLLPAFDEYFIAYKDRSDVIDMAHANKVMTINGIFNPVMVINGQVVGTWKRTFKKDTVTIETAPFKPLKKAQQKALEAAGLQYAQFLDLKLAGFH
ncbi:winged helix DNA-binding protein [Chitinophaga niastensis]|uniref:Winged helix DNA-binding protein n=1 Tax=Chitinophaga niastensis TaxID=536980 RepID=A0A2P8HVA9_CHINA|nr:winged helix DNA-binding domain-containing protein [Chitinophaga niastensis]PSL50167.1 winged helix DNA-binding protein [Chitinophaga niastensis]